METIATIFKVTLYVCGILFFIVIIYEIIKVFYEELTKKKRIQNEINDFYSNLNKFVDILSKLDNEEKPKKTRKKVEKKEEK